MRPKANNFNVNQINYKIISLLYWKRPAYFLKFKITLCCLKRVRHFEKFTGFFGFVFINKINFTRRLLFVESLKHFNRSTSLKFREQVHCLLTKTTTCSYSSHAELKFIDSPCRSSFFIPHDYRQK